MPTEVEPVELEQVTRERYGKYMLEGSFFAYMDAISENGNTNILTVKDPQNYTLVDSIDSLDARYLSV